MDRHLSINVYDASGSAVPGASVHFRVKFDGHDHLLGPVEIQGIKDKPATIQIPAQIDDPVIEVTASYEGHEKSVLVDTRQTFNAIIELDFQLEPEKPSSRVSGFNPLQVLNSARQAVPAVNYALGIAGIAAAGAIVSGFVGQTKAGLIIVALIFIGMVLLFAFAQLAVAKSRSIQLAGACLLWAVLLFFIVFLVFTVTAFAAEWPRPWANFLGIIESGPNVEGANNPKGSHDTTVGDYFKQ
jgi:putative effector of murein hydrolase LrgA (UPF0299 family)